MILFRRVPTVDATRDDEQQIRERHRDLGHARDDGVDPTAEEAGDRAEDQAEEDRDERRPHTDLEGDLGAVEQA